MSSKPTICLNMIVKDESHVIAKTLDNLCKYIDFSYWVISDTGSSDDTKEIIRSFFKNKNIPGEIVEHEWRDFSHNRNMALKCAHNKSDYAFIFDADDCINGNLVLPEVMDKDGYNLKFGKDGCVYERTLLVNNRIEWMYVGVLHEVIVCKKPNSEIVLLDGDYYLDSGRLGSRNNDPNKYQKDAKILEKAFYEAEARNDDIKIRYSFYCGQSYKDCGENVKAIEWYKRRAAYGGWDQEVYFSNYMVGDLYSRIGEIEKAMYYWRKTFENDPQRLEAIYNVMHHHYEKQEWKLAMNCYKLVEPYLDSSIELYQKLFTWKEVYTYLFDFDSVIICFHNRAWREGINAFSRLWKLRDHADQQIIGNIIFNLQFYLDHISIVADGKNTSFDLEKIEVGIDFFTDYIAFLNHHVIVNNYEISEDDFKITNRFKELMRPLLSTYRKDIVDKLLSTTINPKSTELSGKKSSRKTSVFLSFTTCKRIDLFQQTVNSFIQLCGDIEKIDYFYCVDDNSSFEDREQMMKLYPFMNFYFKRTGEKGHRPSMNIIWDKMKELSPDYWIHMEDDWLFIKKDNYVTRSISYLEADVCKSRNVQQVLFNRNYAEIVENFNVVGGEKLQGEDGKPLLLHVKDQPDLVGPNSAYWPHYSFRPSITRASTILDLGNFDSKNNFFERDYADRYFERGFRSLYFDEINCLHIGKLTSESNDNTKNAYALNNMDQFNHKVSQGDSEASEAAVQKKKERPTRIAFHCTQLCERGDAVALYDYAYYNRMILGNDSVIFYKQNKLNREHVITKFQREFICISYGSIEELESLVQQFEVDYMYNIVWGNPTNDYDLISCPMLWHAIFTNTPFSRPNRTDRYAVISRYLTDKHSKGKSFVPHMINMPDCDADDNFRAKLNIPKDAFVIGRYGGSDSFDIGYVHNAIREILRENIDVYFLFANTNRFHEHPRIIYMDTLYEQMDKARFIQSCDMMIHGRTVGETFGIAIGEFSYYNKPVMTNLSVPIANLLSDNCHLEILGDKGFVYKNKEEVKTIIRNMCRDGVDSSVNWRAYDDYSPEKVMQQFKNMYLDETPVYNNEIKPKEQVQEKVVTVKSVEAKPATDRIRTFVVNLERRPDRRKAIDEMLSIPEMNLFDYDFFKAVDGSKLSVTDEITKIFAGNDFGNRRGVVGCALSHYYLWKRLVADESNDFYLILEDDYEFCDGIVDKMKSIYGEMQEKEIIFMGYHMFDQERKKVQDVYGYDKNHKIDNVSVRKLDRDLYVGGTHCYSVNKVGAQKMLDYIERYGIKHGIDYVMGKLNSGICYETIPQLSYADWNESGKQIDSDIQHSYDALDIPVSKEEEKAQRVGRDHYKFFPGYDLLDCDIASIPFKSIEEMTYTSEKYDECVGFNTYGYLKSRFVKLSKSPFIQPPHGVYVNMTRVNKLRKKNQYRVKLLCNWNSSEGLCRQWQKMLPSENNQRENLCWNNFQFTWEDVNVDFYVIINKPPADEYFEPSRTIVFQMEPWCGGADQTWGVKTWGEWARPDPLKFLQVRSHENYVNNAFWQLAASYDDLKYKTPRKSMGNRISSICSSKYIDPGQKKRIDFLKFLEEVENADVQIDIYNEDNHHNFRNYRGRADPDKDKDKGIVPYKYYFMFENNAEKNFITEKIWEPLLTETLCFYDGCPNISEHIDPRAYVQLDMNDFMKSYNIIKQAIKDDLWSKRIDIIRKEKERVLNHFMFFPTVERIIEKEMKMPFAPSTQEVEYNKYFL